MFKTFYRTKYLKVKGDKLQKWVEYKTGKKLVSKKI